MTAAQRKVLERYPEAKCRKHRQTAWYSVGLRHNKSRWVIIGSGQTRGKAWTEAAERLDAVSVPVLRHKENR